MSDPDTGRAGAPPAANADDLARALPAAPPPRPAARTAAIAAALARFDGADAPAHAPPPTAPVRRPAWRRVTWAPVGALASAVLVAVIAVPLALDHSRGTIVSSPPVALDDAADTAPRPTRAARSDASAAPSLAARPPGIVAPLPDIAADRRSRAVAPPAAFAPDVAPAPIVASAPPPPPSPPAPVAAAPATASVVADPPAALAAKARRSTPDTSESLDVVVTGSPVSGRARAVAQRGNWNACTIDDPDERLRGCAGLIRHGAKDGVADTLVEALGRARAGDWSGSIERLDRVIALRPRSGIAYLNRGLAHERNGDTEAAVADLNQAVRFDPSARSFYARARLWRAHGDLSRAHADEGRAVELDPDYAALILDQARP